LNLEIKPYGISRVTTDKVSAPATADKRCSSTLGSGGSTTAGCDAGIDVKYGVTKGLTADFTYHTDFAQVEADEAQVNLTRFTLSFPEKREFFLEGAGIFAFGNSAGSLGPGDSPAGSIDAPTIFYSRRIGLNAAGDVPVIAGGSSRVTPGRGASGHSRWTPMMIPRPAP